MLFIGIDDMRTSVVSVIVPAHNEEENLTECIESLLKVCDKKDYEIIIVNDNSTDNTGKIAEEIASLNENIRVVHRTPPKGFGLTVRKGMENSTGDILVTFMADLSDDASTIPKIVESIKNGSDIVIASRFTSGGKVVNYPKTKYVANSVYNKLLSIVFGKNIRDFTNAFKGYRREILENIELKSDGFALTTEMILKPMVLKNAKVNEIPTTWKNRRRGRANLRLVSVAKKYGTVLLEVMLMKVLRKRIQ